jgi:high-affinity iron transporter
MLPAFAIGFRETLEAVVIVASIISLLVREKSSEFHPKKTIKSLLLAVLASVLTIGMLLFVASDLLSSLSEEVLEFIEGILYLISAFIITYILFYVHKTYSNITKSATLSIQNGAFLSLQALLFISVLREGLEIAVFTSVLLVAFSFSQIIFGLMIGIASALLLGIVLYVLFRKISVNYLHLITSFLLVATGSYLMYQGLHELFEVIPTSIPEDTSGKFIVFFTVMYFISTMWYSVKPAKQQK